MENGMVWVHWVDGWVAEHITGVILRTHGHHIVGPRAWGLLEDEKKANMIARVLQARLCGIEMELEITERGLLQFHIPNDILPGLWMGLLKKRRKGRRGNT